MAALDLLGRRWCLRILWELRGPSLTFRALQGAAVILLLSVLYAGFRELTAVQALFFGIKAAVLAVVIEAVIRIGRRALKNRALYAIAAAAFIAIFFLEAPFPLIVVTAAVVGFIGGRLRPDLFLPQAGHGGAVDDDAVLDMDRFAHTRPSPLRALAVTASCLVH